MTISVQVNQAIPVVDSRSHRQSFEITDLDQARMKFTDFYGQATLDQLPQQHGFQWHSTTTVLGSVIATTDSVPQGAQIALPGCADLYVLVVPMSGVCRVRHHGVEDYVLPAQTAEIHSLMRPTQLQIGADSVRRSLIFDRRAVAAHLCSLTGSTVRRPLLFDPLLDLTSSAGARLAQLVEFVSAQLDAPHGMQDAPLVARQMEQTLFTALLELAPHSQSALFGRAPAALAPACVRRAEEYIDAHAAEPIAITDVAAMVGVSMSALENAFRRVRGYTPLDHLRRRRLDLARVRLLAPEPGMTVAQAAQAAGYCHVSYFIAAYRRRFGETPGATLKRTMGLTF